MKMNEKYEDHMWGQIDILHQKSRRQYTSFTYFMDMLGKFHDTCNEFSKSIQAILSKSHEIIEFHSTSIYAAADKFIQLYDSFSKEFKEVQNSIKREIIDKIYKPTCDVFNRENDLYSNYNDLRKQYNNSKVKMEKFYKNYINGMKLCENLVFNSKQMDSMIYAGENEKKANLKNANNSIKNTKPIEEKYTASVEKVNKDRENEIKFQKDLLNFYQKLDYNFYEKIQMSIGLYLASITKMANSILSSCEFLGNAYQAINVEKDIKDYISSNKVEKKIQQKSKFIPYEPFSDPLKPKEDPKKLDIYFEVIKTLKKNFKDIRNDINMEEEEKRKRLRYLCERIFKIGSNVSFSKEEKKELLEFLEIPSFKLYFILVLTKQRTKGRFKRSESLVKDLSELLLKILDIAEKEKDYESAKNCIILSQTYYYEEKIDDKKKKDSNKIEPPKKYLFELIKNNKWLKSYEFWDGLVSVMVELEIKKNKETSAKQGIEDTEKLIQSRKSNICFSQLLTFSSNMMEFGMNKEDALKIVSSYAEKYGVDKELCDTIYANIDMKLQELNPSLNKEKTENKDISEIKKIIEEKEIKEEEIRKENGENKEKKVISDENNKNINEQNNEDKNKEEKNIEENKKDEIKENNAKKDEKIVEENKKFEENKDMEENKEIKENKKNEKNNIIEDKKIEEKKMEENEKSEEKTEEKKNEEKKENNENKEIKENNIKEENKKIEESNINQEKEFIDENKEIEGLKKNKENINHKENINNKS